MLNNNSLHETDQIIIETGNDMKKKLTLEEIKLEEMLSKIERDLTEKKRAPNFRKKYKQYSGSKK